MDYDVIIIGSGAGGAATAYKLATAGVRTLLIERGPVLPMDDTTLDVERVVIKACFQYSEIWRDRGGRQFFPSEYANLGGKTKWYGAALLRQSPHEFEADKLHQCPAWPVPYSEFEPYYDEAEQLLQLKRFETEPDLVKIVQGLQRHDPGWRKEALPVGLSERILGLPNDAHHFDGFANPRGLKSDAECSLLHRVQGCENLRILTATMALALNGTPDNAEKIASVTCGNGETYSAQAVVLSGGALNSPRLLQAYLNTSGLGQKFLAAENIGRNYKCHLNSALIVFSAAEIMDIAAQDNNSVS